MAKNSEKRLATSQRKKWLQKLQPSDARPSRGDETSPSIVIDSNVWYSAIVFGKKPEEAIDYCLENAIIQTSAILINEVIDRLHHKAAAPYRFRHQLRSRLERICEVHEITNPPAVVRDPDDNQVIATALKSRSSYIITGDEDLLVLGPYKGIGIVKPADFLKLVS